MDKIDRMCVDHTISQIDEIAKRYPDDVTLALAPNNIRMTVKLIDEAEARIKTLEADLADSKKLFLNLSDSGDRVIRRLEADNRKLEAERDGLKANFAIIRKERDEWMRRAEHACQQCADLYREIEELRKERDALMDHAQMISDMKSPYRPRLHADLSQRLRGLADHWRAKGFPMDANVYKLAADELDRLNGWTIWDRPDGTASKSEQPKVGASTYVSAPKAEAKAADGPIHAPEIASSPAYYVGTKDALTGVPIYCITAVGPLVVCRTSGLARSVADALNGLIQGHECRFDKNPWAAKVADLEMRHRALLEAMTAVRDRSIGLFNSVEDAIVKAGGPKS